MRPLYYVTECPDTNRQFLVEKGVDNNIAELTMENVRAIKALFRQMPNTSGKHRRGDDLLAFLADEHKRYMAEIQTLAPSPAIWQDFNVKEQEFDEAKNEFLESLWDVIQQHFEDDENAK